MGKEQIEVDAFRDRVQSGKMTDQDRDIVEAYAVQSGQEEKDVRYAISENWMAASWILMFSTRM